jgi:hypothetical protein
VGGIDNRLHLVVEHLTPEAACHIGQDPARGGELDDLGPAADLVADGAAAVISLRRKRPDTVRPFKVPGYPYTPLLFVLAAAIIVVSTIIEQPVQSAVGIGVVLMGAPAYWLWRRRAAKEAAC